MTIISWNVNGIRAAVGHGLAGFLDSFDADIYAFQETKLHTPMPSVVKKGYHAFWCFSGIQGYSGTLCLTKVKPLSVHYGMLETDSGQDGECSETHTDGTLPYFGSPYAVRRAGLSSSHFTDQEAACQDGIGPISEGAADGFDTELWEEDAMPQDDDGENDLDDSFSSEGRVITLEFTNFYFVCVYVPNSQGSKRRYDYRCEFDGHLYDHVQTLLPQKPVIICGDFNVAPSDIDIYPENSWVKLNSDGYMAAEREDFQTLLDIGFWDSYRRLHPDERGVYSWWSNRLYKRGENKGWRLDYALVSIDIARHITKSTMLTDVMGSDHCPIELVLDMEVEGIEKEPKGQKAVHPQLSDMPQLQRNAMVYGMANADLSFVWENAEWERAEENLATMQMALSKSAYSHDLDLIRKWQYRIVSSLDAKMLAVRHVSSVAASSGVDKVKWKTSMEKMAAALSLSSKDYKALPSRLIFMQTSKGKSRRVHLESWYDRAMQTLYAYSLDPVAEAWGDRKSFAFRKGRSTFDLNEYIKAAFSGKDAPGWAFIGDVRQCYEHISHEWVEEHIPLAKGVLSEFLNAGYVLSGRMFPKDTGIGIGCTLSPIIANMTLDGLQDRIYEEFGRKEGDNGFDFSNGNMIRYADDIIVAVRSKEDAEKVRAVIADFLCERGLELSEKKSRVVNMKEGFTFMSRTYVRRHGNMYVYPSDDAVSRFKAGLKEAVEGHKGSQAKLIDKLNRKISGWVTYHKVEDAEAVFRSVDVYLKALLLKSCEKKHPQWTREKILNNYWYRRHDGTYLYALPDKKEKHVHQLSDALLVVHDKVKTNINPYIEIGYLESREEERAVHNVTGMYRTIWDRQGGACYFCGKPILKDQEKGMVEVDPKAKKKSSRLAYAHVRCMGWQMESVVYTDTLLDSETETMELLKELEAGEKSRKVFKYTPLYEYFRLCDKPSVSLKFKEIEKILGEPLGKNAESKPFWYRSGGICLCWLENGYRIRNIHFDKKYIVFHQEERKAAVDIPKVFLSGRVPEEAKYEVENYLEYIVKKYGL